MLRTPNSASVDEYGYEWRVETPVHPGSPSSRRSNEWLAELWDMRGWIIYQNGYRPSFRSSDGRFSDEDPLDAFSFHVTARLNGKLVGCVRLVRYTDAPMTWAQSVLGKSQIEEVVNSLESSLGNAGECGRWIVEPEERGKHLGRYLMSGVYATARGPVGIMQAVIDTILPYIHSRRQFGKGIGTFELIQAKVADIYTHLEAARALGYHVAGRFDEGERSSRDAAACLLFASECAVKAALESIQIMGARGFMNDSPTSRLLRDAKLYEIGGGTNEIRRILIGRELFAKSVSCAY